MQTFYVQNMKLTSGKGEKYLACFSLFLGRMASLESTSQLFGLSEPVFDAVAAPGDSASSQVICSNYGWVYPEVKRYPSWYHSRERVDQFLEGHTLPEDE